MFLIYTIYYISFGSSDKDKRILVVLNKYEKNKLISCLKNFMQKFTDYDEMKHEVLYTNTEAID